MLCGACKSGKSGWGAKRVLWEEPMYVTRMEAVGDG